MGTSRKWVSDPYTFWIPQHPEIGRSDTKLSFKIKFVLSNDGCILSQKSDYTPNFHIVKFGVTVFFTYFSYVPAQLGYNMVIDRFPIG